MSGESGPVDEEGQLIDTAMQLIDRLQAKVDKKASKKTAAALAISIALDVALTVAFIVNSISLSDTQSAVTSANVSQCRQNNIARAQDAVLWNTLFNDIAPPGTKATAKNAVALREIAGLRSILAAKDAPRNCVKVYG